MTQPSVFRARSPGGHSQIRRKVRVMMSNRVSIIKCSIIVDTNKADNVMLPKKGPANGML